MAVTVLIATLSSGCGDDDTTSTGEVAADGTGVASLADAGANLEAAGYTTVDIPLEGAATKAGANGKTYTADAALNVQLGPDGSALDVSIFEYSDPVALKQVAASYEALAAEASSPLGYAIADNRLYVATDGASDTADEKIEETMQAAGESAPG